MTLEQLAEKVAVLEKEVAELKREARPLSPLPSVEDTFGMFANDPGFDEMVRLGREYRETEGSED
jgi:hypothetical protein